MKPVIYPIILILIFSTQIQTLQTTKITLPQPSTTTDLPTSIKYQQKIGTCFGSSTLSYLTTIINKASTYYRTDYEQNIKYIKQNIDIRFSSKDSSYVVLILTNQTKSGECQEYFYNLEACNFVLLAKGVNKINLIWSYLVYRVGYSASFKWSYVHELGKGQGISTEMQGIIKNTIVIAEGKQKICNCPSLTISLSLQKSLGRPWNTICLPTSNVYGYIPTKTSQWIITHPKLCYYLIYANQS